MIRKIIVLGLTGLMLVFGAANFSSITGDINSNIAYADGGDCDGGGSCGGGCSCN